MDSTFPLISIIIPVSDSEKTLNQCIDSLLYQDYDNREIIIVEMSANLPTMQIVERYKKEFSDIVHVVKTSYTDDVISAVTEGAKTARGEYLCFCDPRDYYQLNAMGVIAQVIGERVFDVAMFWVNTVDNRGNILRTHKLPTDFNKEYVLTRIDLTVFSRTVIKRSYFFEFPQINKLCNIDTVWIPNYIADAIGFVHIPKVLYNYVIHKDREVQKERLNPFVENELVSLDILLNRPLTSYYEEIVMYSAKRLIAFSKIAKYKDICAEWALKYQDAFLKNRYINKSEEIKKALNRLCASYNEYRIPKTAYINGFDPLLTEEKTEHFRNNVFIGGKGCFIVLNESNCNLSELPGAKEALEKGDYDYVGQYFALKKIYETGGFYLGKKLNFTSYLNEKRKYNAIFSYYDSSSFTGEFFGAVSDSEIVQRLLLTYSIADFYDDPFLPLADRIRNVTSVFFERLVVNGKSAVIDGVCFAGPEQYIINLGSSSQIAYIDFSKEITDNALKSEDYIVIPRNAYDILISQKSNDTPRSVKAEINKLKTHINNIESSDTFKIARRLSNLGNKKLFVPLKKLCKWLLKKYRKHKYSITS